MATAAWPNQTHADSGLLPPHRALVESKPWAEALVPTSTSGSGSRARPNRENTSTSRLHCRLGIGNDIMTVEDLQRRRRCPFEDPASPAPPSRPVQPDQPRPARHALCLTSSRTACSGHRRVRTMGWRTAGQMSSRLRPTRFRAIRPSASGFSFEPAAPGVGSAAVSASSRTKPATRGWRGRLSRP
jgi:hypothetical protein